jgi:hypothetical protein
MSGANRWIEWGCAAVLAAGLSSCAALPSWAELPPSNQVAAADPLVYPDLAAIPDRPAGLPGAEQRQAVVEALEADRARTAQAAEDLRRDIETGFEIPAPPPGP